MADVAEYQGTTLTPVPVGLAPPSGGLLADDLQPHLDTISRFVI